MACKRVLPQQKQALQGCKGGRRVRKREFRKLWIIRIGAAARENGLNYNQLIHGLKVAGVDLDRKVLADIALQDPGAFTKLAETARKAASA